MMAAVAEPAGPSGVGRPADRLVARALRNLTWRHWAWASGLGVLASVLVALQTLHINLFWFQGKIAAGVPWYVTFAYVFLLATVLAESSVGESARVPTTRYAAGAAVASAICLAIAMTFAQYLQIAPRREVPGGSDPRVTVYDERNRWSIAVFATGFDGILLGWIATFVHANLRNARMAARELTRAQIERAEADRRLVTSRLAVARARIDPEAVLRMLESIERAYEEDAIRADMLVGELTHHLRDGIPKLREEAGRQSA